MIFVQFQKSIEHLLRCSIKAIQSDWDGEFYALTIHFQKYDIFHRITYPHTHEQNSIIEHKIHYVVDIGLILFAQASIPK